MNNLYSRGSRGPITRMGGEVWKNPLDMLLPGGSPDAETLTKWVIVPGATVAALFILTRVIRKRKGKR